MPSRATSDRSSQHKREAHPEQRLGGPGLPPAPACHRPQRLNQGQQPRPRAPRGPSGRGGRPTSCAWPCPPTRPVRGSSACPAPVRPDRSIMAQRRPSDCGYVTSSHVLRPSGRGVGGARAGLPVRIDARPRRSVSNPRSPRTQAGYPARASPPAESSSLCGAARVWMRHACSLLIAHCSSGGSLKARP